ncbi:MAG TPA: tetratricopeptide repeat protein, partial [Kofleriaceae bacterium]|nr:tetratricopeptide repeat protein [Kofleriaceae bacterium]
FFLKAVAVYKQILKLDPRLVDVILKLAELYRQLGLMSDAMQHYESVAAHFHREGNTKEALDTVKKLVDLDPENIATRIKLAELYSKEGLVDDAVSQFTVACEQLRRQNRQDDFVKVAERLLWHKPDNHALNRELAGLYLRRNDPRRALQKLQACFKADPRDPETLGLLALAFQALDQRAKTVSVLKELARIQVENKARDKAAEVYRKILEIVPNDPDALQYLGPQAAQRPIAPRAPTPLPPAIRAATGDAKFNLTGDLPSIPPSTRMTGSMPLVDEQSLSGVDFALPEYDDGDFSADMEPPPDPRRASAAGERHAEEISKILAETDVYVKYGLHQKAVDHLRRVFTLDEQNVEAHERLKDILISQGREQEAEVELLKLAELVAPADPDRAEQYLQELLAMNGTHTGAFELARKFRLRVARMSSVSSEVEYQGGGVAELDPDAEELDLAAPPPGARGAIGVAAPRRDSIDDFDPDELIGGGGHNNRIAHGSPTPARPPRRPESQADDSYDLDFEPSPSQSTRQVPAEHVERLAQMAGEELDDELIAQRPPSARGWELNTNNAGFDGARAYGSPSLDDVVEAQLDDDALGADIDQGVVAELGAPENAADDEDLPFDPDAARAFDAGVPKVHTEPVYVSGFEETDMPNVDRDGSAYDEASDPLAVAGSYDPYGGEGLAGGATLDATAMEHALPDPGIEDSNDAEPIGAPGPAGARAESVVEEDLDEADFYASQGMYPEALDVLRGMLARYNSHPLIVAKMREVEAMAGGVEIAVDTPPAGHVASVDIALDHSGGTDALDLDELEEVSDDDLVEVEDAESSGAKPGKRKPTVMLEKPVDEGDAETHYDLGLAYKEMGLYDEAIKAFEKVLRAPGREVQCRVMLGMCQREQGSPSEAIHEFKSGLHANPSDRERLSLYYEIGVTYESMGDEGEALYYFEAVTKRDPQFADAGPRAEALRVRVGHSTPPSDDDL